MQVEASGLSRFHLFLAEVEFTRLAPQLDDSTRVFFLPRRFQKNVDAFLSLLAVIPIVALFLTLYVLLIVTHAHSGIYAIYA